MVVVLVLRLVGSATAARINSTKASALSTSTLPDVDGATRPGGEAGVEDVLGVRQRRTLANDLHLVP